MGIDEGQRQESAICLEKDREVEAFVAQKMLHLEQYDADLAETEADKARVDQVEMTKADFLAKHVAITLAH